jgi:hypothetical protein
MTKKKTLGSRVSLDERLASIEGKIVTIQDHLGIGHSWITEGRSWVTAADMRKSCVKVEVGQIWENNDPRKRKQRKKVVALDGPYATLKDLDTGRESTVTIKSFLARQGQHNGYTFIKEEDRR